MGGGMRAKSDACVCVRAHLYVFIECALILPLLVRHKTVVIDNDTLSVFLPKQQRTASCDAPGCETAPA